ncbi:MAG: TIGR03749 family integrating conjugative element protein [Acidiferrobacterales bacterium]|nr:TIGR03749 family integrating conjugative element protein [Acidiferrobacterales bacterium]
MNTFVVIAKVLAVNAILVVFISKSSADSITYIWNEKPIDIDLQVGKERNIHIPDAGSLRVGIPHSIDDRLIPQVIGNHLWLTALDELDSTRIVLIAEHVGRLILQVRARHAETSDQPIVIRQFVTETTSAPPQSQPNHGYVALTRWVVQKFYAPERLVEDFPGVVRVSLDKTPADLFHCGNRVPTACAGAVTAVPLASWKSSQHFITALHVTNKLAESVVLDPRELRGTWRTAAFLHTRLHPNGQYGDSTMLVLISDFPFENPTP